MNGIQNTIFSRCAILSALLIVSIANSCCSTSKIAKDEPKKDGQQQEDPSKPGEDTKPTYKAFTFVQLSDPQLGFLNGNSDYEADSLLLARAVKKTNNLQPDFVIVTGDMTNASGSAKQIKCYKTVMSAMDKRIPVYMVPGNHDIGGGSTDEKVAAYIKNYGYDHYSFEYEACKFIGINSCVIKDSNMVKEAEQFEWIKSELDASKDARLTFVITHHSFFLNSYLETVSYSNQCMGAREKYWGVFTKGGVDCVIAGHLHDNKYAKYQGIEMVTVGPVGKPLNKGYSGVAVWSVTAEGTYSYKYYSIDEFEALEKL